MYHNTFQTYFYHAHNFEHMETKSFIDNFLWDEILKKQ